MVARERPTGPVRPVQSGCQPDDQEARPGCAERRDRPAMVVRVLAADAVEESREPRATAAVGIERGARPALRRRDCRQSHRPRHPALLPGESRNARARRASASGPWNPALAAAMASCSRAFQPAAIHSDAIAALSVPATMRPADSTWKSIARMRPCGERPGAARVGTGSGWWSSSRPRSDATSCSVPRPLRFRRGKQLARGGEQVLPCAAHGLIPVPAFELQVEAAELRVHPQRAAWIGGFEAATHAGDRRIERTLLRRGFEGGCLRRRPAPALGHLRRAAQVGARREQSAAGAVDRRECRRGARVQFGSECRRARIRPGDRRARRASRPRSARLLRRRSPALRRASQRALNCASSVEPRIAVIEEFPPLTVCVTSSK